MSDNKMFSFSSIDTKPYEGNKVFFNKMYSDTIKKAKSMAKSKKCYLCGKDITNFCNSHSIPQFCLKNITQNGYVYSINALLKLPFAKKELGITNAGTFHLVCSECDGTKFSDYENPIKYSNESTPIMLSQIAMKTYLKEIYKKRLEKAYYELMKQKFDKQNKVFYETLNNRLEITDIDLADYEKKFQYTRKQLLKNPDNKTYYMCYYRKLDYIVPLAFQNKITLISGFDNGIIHNIYDYSSIIEDLHVCVFPIDNFSIVMMFIKNGSTKHRKFYKMLKRLNPIEQLHAISYIIFLYSEEIYMSKNLENIIKDNKAFKETAQKTSMIYHNNIEGGKNIFIARDEFNLDKRNTFPNLLSQEYKIND